jgi:hypothetical protein
MSAQKQAAFVQQLNLVDITERLRYTYKEKEQEDSADREEDSAEIFPI